MKVDVVGLPEIIRTDEDFRSWVENFLGLCLSDEYEITEAVELRFLPGSPKEENIADVHTTTSRLINPCFIPDIIASKVKIKCDELSLEPPSNYRCVTA